MTKKWANLVYLVFFIFFKGLQNVGKYFKPNFPIKVWRSNVFFPERTKIQISGSINSEKLPAATGIFDRFKCSN